MAVFSIHLAIDERLTTNQEAARATKRFRHNLLLLCLHRASMAVSKLTPRYYTPGVRRPLHPSTSAEVELEYANCEASES